MGYTVTKNGSTWKAEDEATKVRKNPKTPTTNKPVTPISDNPSQKKASKKVQEKEFNLEGTVNVTIANPHYKARRTMAFYGLGSLFSGNYRVITVINTIDKDSGYEQSLEVKRNAFGTRIKPTESTSNGRTDPQKIDANITKTYHTIARGDTLWSIAKKFYGDGSKYPKIATANGLPNNTVLKVGTKLIIPE